MKESRRNWLEMPPEVMENILKRLDIVEILLGKRKVCTTWRRICEDPAMWKVIDMSDPLGADADPETCIEFQKLTKEAVDLSCGELIELSIGWFGNDQLLDDTVRPYSSSKLKYLYLWGREITGDGLTRVAKNAPHLEKLLISCTDMLDEQTIEVIGRNCPELKSFNLEGFDTFYEGDKYALAIANNMPELRHLHLSSTRMTNNGLQAILNGCPHLQSLHICMSSELDLRGNLGKLCTERIKDFKCQVVKIIYFNHDWA